MANIRQALYAWRDNEASKRAVELFRILPNTALEEIVKSLPRTKEELTAIKGIKDAKYHTYGQAILSIIDEYAGANAGSITSDSTKGDGMERLSSLQGDEKATRESIVGESTFSVSNYLDIVNAALWRFSARVKGEITSFKIQGSAIYMTIKDRDDDSIMNVFMWLSDYQLSGIEVAEGLEVIIEGKSEIYKPNGRMNFRAQTIELVGEGALKKAYDALKKKLEAEGMFALEKKRPLPEFPERIGLITSKQGAVIHDFLNNLGKYGYKVRFTDARVEGIGAVKELLAAIKYFTDKEIDTLVVIRGGGSLESLAAFNHELVVRALASFPKPVICAIGHDKDVPLAQLVCDNAPSTPTAATALLNASWQEAETEVAVFERKLVYTMNERLLAIKNDIQDVESRLARAFSGLRNTFDTVARSLESYIPLLEHAIEQTRSEAKESLRVMLQHYSVLLAGVRDSLERVSIEIETHNPLRQLRLGYSILAQKGKVLREVSSLSVGAHFEATLADGTLQATIINITKNP